MKKTKSKILLTCEHGGAQIPKEYQALFTKAKATLKTHRGLDIGALDIAKDLKQFLKVPLVYSEVSRLLVDLNRSEHNPTIFSEFTRHLNSNEKRNLIRHYYEPYHLQVRQKIQTQISRQLSRSNPLIHIGIHSFTPVFKNKVRSLDIGVLYDSKRECESFVAEQWIKELKLSFPDLKIKANQPYRGSGDGIATFYRLKYSDKKFLSLELEINQKLISKLKSSKMRKAFSKTVCESLIRSV